MFFSFSRCKSKSNASVRTATDEAAMRALLDAVDVDEEVEEVEEEDDDEDGDGFILARKLDCIRILTSSLAAKPQGVQNKLTESLSCLQLFYFYKVAIRMIYYLLL